MENEGIFHGHVHLLKRVIDGDCLKLFHCVLKVS